MRYIAKGRLGLPALVGLLFLAGCNKPTPQPPPPPPPQGGGTTSFIGGPSAPAQGAVRRGMEIQKAKGHLNNIKQFYAIYKTERGRGPANLNDFLQSMQKDDPTLAKHLQEGAITMVFKPGLSGEALLAYVSFEDGAGNRAVLTEAGEVKVMNTYEFEAAQKR